MRSFFHSGSPQDIKIRQTMYTYIKGMEGSGNFSTLGTLGRVSEAGEANSNNVKCFLILLFSKTKSCLARKEKYAI